MILTRERERERDNKMTMKPTMYMYMYFLEKVDNSLYISNCTYLTIALDY